MKSINNTTGSQLVSCRVIPRPATLNGWEKEMFLNIRALGNLRCNKSNKIVKILEKILENNCIKSELVQKDFWWILLKLQVTSLNSPELVGTTVL